MQNLDQAIRERAYHLWLADGRRDGQADAYWLAAQRSMLSEALADPAIQHAASPHAVAVAAEAESTKYPAKKAKSVAVPKKAKRRAA